MMEPDAREADEAGAYRSELSLSSQKHCEASCSPSPRGIRNISDGTLESELKSSRNTIRHLLNPTCFSDDSLAQILSLEVIP